MRTNRNNVTTMSSITACSTDASMAQDLTEATAHFPSIALKSPAPGSPSPIAVPSRTPSPIHELEAPTLVPKCKRITSAGANPWAPIVVPSQSPSPVSPKKPLPMLDAGPDALPVKSWGSNPGSPIPGLPSMTTIFHTLHCPRTTSLLHPPTPYLSHDKTDAQTSASTLPTPFITTITALHQIRTTAGPWPL